MAHKLDHSVLRFALALVGACLIVYAVTPPSHWRLMEGSAAQASCPPCFCDCFSEAALSLPSDCGKHDPALNEEMQKDIVALLSDELNLQRIVINDTLEHSQALIDTVKRTSSHYQKEAIKCNIGMETCEEARERAEAELREELKLTALWEKRAREIGWTDKREVYKRE